MSLYTRRRPATPSLALIFDALLASKPPPLPLLDHSITPDPPVPQFTSHNKVRPRSKSTSRSRPSSSLLPFDLQPLPPTPPFGLDLPLTPASSRLSLDDAHLTAIPSNMFANAQAGPSSGFPRSILPRTPPGHDEDSVFGVGPPSSNLAFSEPLIPQRERRGRRPPSGYPVLGDYNLTPERPTHRSSHMGGDDQEQSSESGSQQLDVDLDAYSTVDYDVDDSVEPTLSIVTSSTVDSTTGTPASIGAQYDFHDLRGDKMEPEPRIRVRTTAGRTSAYSSAESSMASNPYSQYGYGETYYHHPHPPPMPTLPGVYASPVERVEEHDLILPRRQRESHIDSSPSTTALDSPANSFAHRPWKRDIPNHQRRPSASSDISNASEGSAADVGSQRYSFADYSGSLPWEDEALESTPEALALVKEGKDKTFDVAKLEAMGGLSALSKEAIANLKGVTHLLLPDVGSSLAESLELLVSTLAHTLVVLDISSNYISFLPESLQNCSSLEELNISGNPIRSLPIWVRDLTSLRMLVADECGLSSLPQELSGLASLHTICARRNLLVCLPSWLSLLPRLETLCIDDNPFAKEWVPIVAPILSKPVPASATATRSSSFHSEVVSHDSPTFAASATGPSPLASVNSQANSAAQSMQHLGLGAISEDQPHSAPIQRADVINPEDDLAPPPSFAQRSIRRMRSASSLIDHSLGPSSPVLSAIGAKNKDSSLTRPPAPINTGRYPSLSVKDGRRIPSGLGGTDSDPDLSPSFPGKGGRWASIRRKISMHRLKPEKGKDAIAASAVANLKSLPSPMVHSMSDSGPSAVRPNLLATRSANTLPTRTMYHDGMNEFGQSVRGTTATPAPTVSPQTLLPSAGLPATTSLLGTTGGATKRGKRKSFLPIDGPPLITINIPQGSPFAAEQETLPDVEEDLAPAEVDLSDEAPFPSADRTSQAEDKQIERYAQGLETIKGYLRDLYDLSRPPIEPYGGFEVIPNTESSYAVSSSNSDIIGSTSSYFGMSIANARRGRRPTIDPSMSSTPSSNNTVSSDKGSFHESSESFTGKKLKDDKAKRVRIINEILETERTYVSSLQELMSIYVVPSGFPVSGSRPLPGQRVGTSLKNSDTVIPAAERKIVFGGVEPILQIHEKHFLPALGRTIAPLVRSQDQDGQDSIMAAQKVGEVFRTYIAYMKQYSTYTNNFENALSRMRMWSASASQPGTLGFVKSNSAGGVSSVTVSAGIGASLGPISPTMGDSMSGSGSSMTAAQRKRVKAFLKAARKERGHSQISLESYLLLPIQRIPRYKMLLEQLAMATPPRTDGQRDALDDAYNEIASLASLMNEEKRDADSRLRLFQWQQRISSRGPSPLVQPHRKLVLDGALNLMRVVKKSSAFVEVDTPWFTDNEQTITISKSVVPVEYIVQEPMDHPIMLVLCTDLLVLVQQTPGQDGWEGQVDLFNVLRMGTVHEPASVSHGNVLRIVDNKSIYYFHCPSSDAAVSWSRAINSARRR